MSMGIDDEVKFLEDDEEAEEESEGEEYTALFVVDDPLSIDDLTPVKFSSFEDIEEWNKELERPISDEVLGKIELYFAQEPEPFFAKVAFANTQTRLIGGGVVSKRKLLYARSR